MRGLLTGVVLELRRCILALAMAGEGRIIASGSSLASPRALPDLADACEREVLADMSDADHSALGAIDVLLEGVGESRLRRSAELTRFAPSPEAVAQWRVLAERHERNLERERERVASLQQGAR